MCSVDAARRRPSLSAFGVGRHVDAGRRRLYSFPFEVSLGLCGSIASDGRAGGSNMHDVIRLKVFGKMICKVWERC
jgi:hypothetical protein